MRTVAPLSVTVPSRSPDLSMLRSTAIGRPFWVRWPLSLTLLTCWKSARTPATSEAMVGLPPDAPPLPQPANVTAPMVAARQACATARVSLGRADGCATRTNHLTDVLAAIEAVTVVCTIPYPEAMMTVRVERSGPVTTVILDRPEVRNAVDGPTATALAEAFAAFDADPGASVAVLSG